MGDVVTIRSRHLGALVNTVGAAEELPPWRVGLRQLFAYLAGEERSASAAGAASVS
jgi:fumarylacetoacetate (FAA) hydrolase family protein